MGEFLAVLFCAVILAVVGVLTVGFCIRLFRWAAQTDKWRKY